MCLVVAAWRAHPRYKLVIAANRDEFHERPSSAVAVWPDAPRLLAGRDLQAGGSWLGVDQARRFAVITNYRELARPRPNAPSRGGFVPAYLQSAASAQTYLSRIEVDAAAYAGFSLLLADDEQLWFASNRADRFARSLQPGIYGLSNHLLDTPWPKLLTVRTGLRTWLDTEASAAQPQTAALFAMLADRRPVPVPAELHSGLPAEVEAALSSPFVSFGGYGTRCSTLLLLGFDGELLIRERRFDAAGAIAGQSEYQLNSTQWPSAVT